MTTFKAWGTRGSVIADTPRQAALNFFTAYPSLRKCNVLEGELEGKSFVVTYDPNKWPRSWTSVTTRIAKILPEA